MVLVGASLSTSEDWLSSQKLLAGAGPAGLKPAVPLGELPFLQLESAQAVPLRSCTWALPVARPCACGVCV